MNEEASGLLWEFNKVLVKRIDILKQGNSVNLWSKSVELAAKVTLICTCADNPDTSVIEERHAAWAIRFVTHHTERLVTSLKGPSGDHSARPSRRGSHRNSGALSSHSSAVSA